MTSLIKKIHHLIPAKARGVYMPLVEKVLGFFQRHINALFPLVTIYEGLEAKSRAPLSFAYAGDLKKMDKYWDHLILSDGFQERSLGRRFVGKIIPGIKKDFPNCGLVIAEQSCLTAPYLSHKHGLPIPSWIRMEIDLSPPFDELFPKRRNDIKRLIRKNKLSCEVTREPESFDDFFFRMYKPYINMRYTDDARVGEHKDFLKKVPGSELLLIKKEDKIIAGAMFEFKNNVPMLRRLGIVDANMEYVRCGAIGAIYYFIAEEVKKRGHDLLDIGGTRPFLSDGLSRFKLALGARLSGNNSEHSCVRLMVLQDTPGVRNFLTHHAFIIRDRRKKLCRVLFVEDSGESLPRSIADADASSVCGGTAETRVYVFGNARPPKDLNPSGRRPLRVLPAERLINR